ncbi:MAG: endolytic transglycosylase MltG [Phycisphaerales bacterium]|nr:endolytic transglycosylase MltG [Phycisphaerales bacterium]
MSAQKKKTKKTTSASHKGWRIVGYLALVVLLLALYFLFAPNTGSFTQGDYVYIHTGADYQEVKKTLEEGGFVSRINSFDVLAQKSGYPQKVHPGKYLIKKGMSNFSILRLLQSGKQSPVKLVITKLRTRQDFIRLVSRNLEADSAVLQHILTDPNYLSQYGLVSNTALCAVMPNTYEFYWNSSAEKVFKKIAQRYVNFWNNDRKNQAQNLGLTPQQVIIIASIVEEESNKNDEKPNIASVYINRLKIGMKLQADPTARFAYGDFNIKRITSVQTNFESPYNTYWVRGLPPGPICTPSEKSIDAVLKSPHTNYLYFCAKKDFSGYHSFAANLQEHTVNARKYHDALNARGIR